VRLWENHSLYRGRETKSRTQACLLAPLSPIDTPELDRRIDHALGLFHESELNGFRSIPATPLMVPKS